MLNFINKITLKFSNMLDLFDNKHKDYNNRIKNRGKSLELVKYKAAHNSNDNKKNKTFYTKHSADYTKTGFEVPRTSSPLRRKR